MPVNAEDIGSILRAGKFPWRRKHSCVLACKIPYTEESSGLQSVGLQRVRHDWACTSMAKKKKNLVVRCAVTWVGLEIIILSKVSQTEKSKYCMISCICGN